MSRTVEKLLDSQVHPSIACFSTDGASTSRLKETDELIEDEMGNPWTLKASQGFLISRLCEGVSGIVFSVPVPP